MVKAGVNISSETTIDSVGISTRMDQTNSLRVASDVVAPGRDTWASASLVTLLQ